MRVSARMNSILPSRTKQFAQRAKARIAMGQDVILLCQGELDFETPKNIADAGRQAISDGCTRYTPIDGIPQLHDAIFSHHFAFADQAGDVALTVGCGAKQLIYVAFLCLLDVGDTVLLPSPGWVTYEQSAKLVGACTKTYSYKVSRGRWTLDFESLEKSLESNPRVLVINNPHNPTGAVLTAREIECLDALLKKFPQTTIICDEIYSRLTFASGGQVYSTAQSLQSCSDRVVLIDGVSKAFAMTGWRFGYAIGQKEVVSEFNKCLGHMSSHPASVSQHAALEALTGTTFSPATFSKELRIRAEAAVDGFRAVQGVEIAPSEGGMYVFPNFSDYLALIGEESDFALAENLLDAGVALMPGSAFGMPGYMRVSLTQPVDILSEGISRIASVLEGRGCSCG